MGTADGGSVVTAVTRRLAEFIATAEPPDMISSPDSLEFGRYLRELSDWAPSATELGIATETGLRLKTVLRTRTVGGWSALTAALCIAGAAMSARARALNTAETERAIGIASTQVAGFSALDDTPLGVVQRQHAVTAGAAAAQMAAVGVEGHGAGLEGRRGLFALIAPGANPHDVVEGLGVQWFVDGGK